MLNTFYSNSPYINNTEDETSILMTPLEMSNYLGIGRNLAYQLLNEGIIKGFRIGKQWKVSKQAIDLYVAQSSGLI